MSVWACAVSGALIVARILTNSPQASTGSQSGSGGAAARVAFDLCFCIADAEAEEGEDEEACSTLAKACFFLSHIDLDATANARRRTICERDSALRRGLTRTDLRIGNCDSTISESFSNTLLDLAPDILHSLSGSFGSVPGGVLSQAWASRLM